MKDYNELNEEIAGKMRDLSIRLFILKHGFKAFSEYLDKYISSEYSLEITSLFTFLNEFFDNTKLLYNEIEKDLNTQV